MERFPFPLLDGDDNRLQRSIVLSLFVLLSAAFADVKSNAVYNIITTVKVFNRSHMPSRAHSKNQKP